jgi:non-specific protein-tyrosine kinase
MVKLLKANPMEQIEPVEPSIPSIDIKQYLYLLWSWAWLILLTGVLAAAAAYVVSKRMTPVYEASTRLLISAPSNTGGLDPFSLVTTQTMISTYSEMLVERQVLQGVIDQLGLATTAEDLKDSITVEIVLNTQLMVVTVEDTDPQLAADIANSIATVFTDRIRQLQSQRFAASREGLAKQVSEMEARIATISSEIEAIEQQMSAAATQTAVASTATASAISTQTATAIPAATQQVAPVVPSAMPALSDDPSMDPAVLVQLQARLNQYLAIYANLLTSYEQVRLAEAQTSTNVVISESANVPSKPVRPRTMLNTFIAVALTMSLVAGVVLVRDALDDTIKGPDEFSEKFNLQILGVIESHGLRNPPPITIAEPGSSSAEAFRSLRTNILFASVQAPLRRILVTSPLSQSGKTTIASNLAVVFAQGGKTTLLLDADLRRPSIPTQFGLSNSTGLSDLFILPSNDFSSVIQTVNEPYLAVITSGVLPAKPSELLTSKKMRQILDRLKLDFDLIVIDSPSVLTVTDAAALAPTIDGVILVVKPGVTKLGAVQQALDQLRAVRARVLGVVLNDVNLNSRKYGYFYHRY